MTDIEVLVLVADDNLAVRETTSMILKSFGYAVTEAIDGEDALEKLAAGPYDVAVLGADAETRRHLGCRARPPRTSSAGNHHGLCL